MLADSVQIKNEMSRDSYPIENTLSLLIAPHVTNIHLSPSALMNEVTRRNKGFLGALSQLIPFLSEQIQQNNNSIFSIRHHSNIIDTKNL